MERIDKIKKFQKEKDAISRDIDEQYKVIISEDYTIEDKRKASKRFEKLYREYNTLNYILKHSI